MRKVVVVEGTTLPSGVHILKGSLSVRPGVIPVTYAYDWNHFIGRALIFERNENTGEISFEIKFDPRMSMEEREAAEKMEAYIFCTEVETEPGAKVLTKGTIAQISLGHDPVPDYRKYDPASENTDNQQQVDDEERRFMELTARGEDPYNEDGSIKSLPGHREFRIERTEFPAAFRFGAQIFQEFYDIDANEVRWIEVSEDELKRWVHRSGDDRATHNCSCHNKNQGPCPICKQLGCEVWDFNQYPIPKLT